ncbi:MAG: hypothetical protein LBI87_12225, partial [Candidatus Accumulibacter sp.]|nr:hypothetical protein [Accumulibacter sp.]
SFPRTRESRAFIPARSAAFFEFDLAAHRKHNNTYPRAARASETTVRAAFFHGLEALPGNRFSRRPKACSMLRKQGLLSGGVLEHNFTFVLLT